MLVYSYQVLPIVTHGLEQWIAIITLKDLESGKHSPVSALEPRWSIEQAKSDALKKLNELRKGN
jgi:hypothetical protein